MDRLPLELLQIIVNNLSLKDVLKFFQTTKKIYNSYFNVEYNQPVKYNVIKDLEFSDNFNNITYYTHDFVFPKKRRGISQNISIKKLIIHDFKGSIEK